MPTTTLHITSAGTNAGNTAAFVVDDRPITMQYSRGLNILVYDPITRRVIHTDIFDTATSTEAANDFATLIDILPPGHLVALAVLGDASTKMTDRSKRACESIGSGLIYNLTPGASWGLAGQKGAAPGSAIEVLDHSQQVSFIAEVPLPDPGDLPARLRVSSTGLFGPVAWLDLSGEPIALASRDQQGLHVAVIGPSRQVTFQKTYDVHTKPDASDQFASMIESLSPGSVVAVAIDGHQVNLSERAKRSFEILGSDLINRIQAGDAFAMIGQKGIGFGAAAEALSHSMPVLCETWILPQFPQGQGFSVSISSGSLAARSPLRERECNTLIDGVIVGALRPAVNGILVTVIDETQGTTLQSVTFRPNESMALATFLRALPMGRIVAISMANSVDALSDAALTACTLLGSSMIYTAKLENSAFWSLIGRKGASPGSVPEAHGQHAVALQCWFPSPQADWRRVYANIRVRSAGFEAGNFASITVNDREFARRQRGMNVVIIDEKTGNPLQTVGYDTYELSQAADNFAALLEGLPAGRIVAVAVMDEANERLTDRAKRACNSIGSARIRQLTVRGSWAVVGCKGAPVGSAIEAVGARDQTSCVAYQLFTTRAKNEPGTRICVSSTPQRQAAGAVEIRVNNQVVSVDNGPGLQVAVIDRNSGQVTSQARYDPSQSSPASDTLADVIEQLPSGTLVAIAAQSNAITHLTARAKKACSMIGSGLISQLEFGDRWVIAGMKGIGAGSVMEAANPQGGVALEAWWPALPPVSQKRVGALIAFGVLIIASLAKVAAEQIYLNASVHELDKCYPEPTPLQPTPDPGLQPARGSAHKAVFVGMRYSTITRLRLPEQVSAMVQNHRRRLCNLGFFAEPDAHLLLEGSTATAPTRSNVLNELAWLIQDAKEGDVLYFYFLGHGTVDTRGARHEALELLSGDPQKIELLYDLDLLNVVTGLSPKINLTMIFHCCHSGGITEEEIPFEVGGNKGISIAAVDRETAAILDSGLTYCLNKLLVSYRSQSKEWPTYRVLFDEVTRCLQREVNQTPVIRHQGYEVEKLKFLDFIV